MPDETTLALRPDLFGQLAATDPFQGRARRLYERGQVLAVNGNQADVRVGYDARNNPLDLKEVPIVSGYIPRVGDWVAIQYEAGHSGAPWVAGPSMAADESEDTPGIGVFSVSSEEPTDPPKSTVYFHEPASTWRGWNGAAWVDLGGGGGGLHNSLPDLQGGAAGEYYHLTAAQWNALVDNMPFAEGAVLFADSGGAIKSDAASLFWDATKKRLRIGPSGSDPSPTSPGLHMSGDTHIWNWLCAHGSGYPIFTLARARGTHEVPTALLAGDIMGRYGYGGYDGSGWRDTFHLRAYAEENWTDTKLGTRLEVWGTVSGASEMNRWLLLSNQQVLLPGGSASAPALAKIGQTGDGIFWPGEAKLGFALSNAERMRLDLDTLRLGDFSTANFANGRVLLNLGDSNVAPIIQAGVSATRASAIQFTGYAGNPPTYPGYGVWSLWNLYWDETADVWRQPRGSLYSLAAGVAYHGKFSWIYGASGGVDDGAVSPALCMGLDHNGVWWLFPHSPSLTADGEAAMNSADRTFDHRIGGQVHQNGAGLFAAAGDSVSGSGPVAETAFVTTTGILSTLWQAGKGFRIVAYVEADMAPGGNGGNCTFRVYLGGQLIARADENWSGGLKYVNARLCPEVFCKTRSASGVVDVSRMAFCGRGDSGAMDDTAAQVLVKTRTPLTMNTTATQTISVTYEVMGAAPGSWHFDLKYVFVESIC